MLHYLLFERAGEEKNDCFPSSDTSEALMYITHLKHIDSFFSLHVYSEAVKVIMSRGEEPRWKESSPAVVLCMSQLKSQVNN